MAARRWPDNDYGKVSRLQAEAEEQWSREDRPTYAILRYSRSPRTLRTIIALSPGSAVASYRSGSLTVSLRFAIFPFVIARAVEKRQVAFSAKSDQLRRYIRAYARVREYRAFL